MGGERWHRLSKSIEALNCSISGSTAPTKLGSGRTVSFSAAPPSGHPIPAWH